VIVERWHETVHNVVQSDLKEYVRRIRGPEISPT
jgi:D-aminopeptidase